MGHFYVLSPAGKPIYSKTSSSVPLLPQAALIHTIISSFIEQEDSLSTIRTEKLILVFVTHAPLSYLAVCPVEMSETSIKRQLNFLHDQILMNITQFRLNRIFKQDAGFDLQSLLSGCEKALDYSLNQSEISLDYSMSAVHSLCMPIPIRQSLNLVIQSFPESLLFGMICHQRHAMSFMNPQKLAIHSKDLLLLITHILSSPSSFKSSEGWVPVCLPHYNPNSFLNLYCSFLTSDIYLVLVSNQADAFFDCSEYRSLILEKMEKLGILEELSFMRKGVPLISLELPTIRYFAFKYQKSPWMIEPLYEAPYSRREERLRLTNLYRQCQHLISTEAAKDTTRQVHLKTHHESVYYLNSSRYELFVAFDPWISKEEGLNSIHSLLQWIRQHHSELFLD